MGLSDSSLIGIRAEQLEWARGIALDPERPDYVERPEYNLFLKRLNDATKGEFDEADGAELKDTARRPAKMPALMSSSALAVNVFDAWRGVDCEQLGLALGLNGALRSLRFEFRPDKYPVKPRSLNLDVLLTLDGGSQVAVESKFTEPYQAPKTSALSEKYFAGTRRLWEAASLPQAQRIAETFRPRYCHLDVPQLLKHMLGLASDPNAPKLLLYLWYDTRLPDADAHRSEVREFAEAVRGDVVQFAEMTYQELFRAVSEASDPVEGWNWYLGNRYFRGFGSQ